MARLLLFAAIREAAKCNSTVIDASSVSDLIDTARQQFGAEFDRLLPYCSTFVDGEPAIADTRLNSHSEVALLPPVSGGAR